MPARSLMSLLLLPLALTLWQCDRLRAMTAPPAEKPTAYDFSVALELTPAAAAKMAETHDRIIVSTFFYGFATAASKPKADPLGRVRLGYDQRDYANTTRAVHVTATELDSRLLPEVSKNEPWVLVKAFTTAPQGYPDGVLDCQSVAGAISDLQKAAHTISCDIATP